MANTKTEQAVKSFFVSAERAGRDELLVDIDIVSNNPVISGLLASVGGLIAVLTGGACGRDGERSLSVINMRKKA